MIYFLQAEADGPIKIGTSEVMSSRMAQHAAALGKPVGVLGVVEGGREEEQAIHERFHHLRKGKRPNEWFKPAPELLDFIESATSPWDGSSERECVWKVPALAFQMRGSPEFKTWLDELAEFDATDKSELAERAFGAYARQIGFAKPRPKR